MGWHAGLKRMKTRYAMDNFASRAAARVLQMQFAVGHPRSKTLVTFTTHLLSRRRKPV